MPNLERRGGVRDRLADVLQGPPPGQVSRQSQRNMTRLEEKTVGRVWDVRGEAVVAVEKSRQVDRVAMSAMTGQASLRRMLHVLAEGDPILADELDAFAGMARLGKLRILDNLIYRYDIEGQP